jgi:hypothetical protein
MPSPVWVYISRDIGVCEHFLKELSRRTVVLYVDLSTDVSNVSLMWLYTSISYWVHIWHRHKLTFLPSLLDLFAEWYITWLCRALYHSIQCVYFMYWYVDSNLMFCSSFNHKTDVGRGSLNYLTMYWWCRTRGCIGHQYNYCNVDPVVMMLGLLHSWSKIG